MPLACWGTESQFAPVALGALERPTAVDPPVHDAEAEHVDDQDPKPANSSSRRCPRPREASRPAALRHWPDQESQGRRDPASDPVRRQARGAHDDQPLRVHRSPDGRYQPLGADGHLVRQQHLIVAMASTTTATWYEVRASIAAAGGHPVHRGLLTHAPHRFPAARSVARRRCGRVR